MSTKGIDYGKVRKAIRAFGLKREGITAGDLKIALEACDPTMPVKFAIAETGQGELVMDLGPEPGSATLVVHTYPCERRIYSFDDEEIEDIIADDGTRPGAPTC